MGKVYVVYMVSKGIDDTTNILGVYDTREKAEGKLLRSYTNIINNMPYRQGDYSKELGRASIYFDYNGESKFYLKEVDLNYDNTLN